LISEEAAGAIDDVVEGLRSDLIEENGVSESDADAIIE
jgi:hypothetical protein